MSHEDIIHAWKDEEYRNNLSEEQRAQLPENPAGLIELPDESMQTIAGGRANTDKPIFGICIPTIGAGDPCNNISIKLVLEFCF
jgi:mersacidin/lichenicidin family type 2 lantibiotic